MKPRQVNGGRITLTLLVMIRVGKEMVTFYNPIDTFIIKRAVTGTEEHPNVVFRFPFFIVMVIHNHCRGNVNGLVLLIRG